MPESKCHDPVSDAHPLAEAALQVVRLVNDQEIDLGYGRVDGTACSASAEFGPRRALI
jgi:hypothetical protein